MRKAILKPDQIEELHFAWNI